jgi:hypothetical protein
LIVVLSPVASFGAGDFLFKAIISYLNMKENYYGSINSRIDDVLL